MMKSSVSFYSSEFLLRGVISVSFLLSGDLSGMASSGLIASSCLVSMKFSVSSSLWNLSDIKFLVCFPLQNFFQEFWLSVSFLLSGDSFWNGLRALLQVLT